ncbi:hypothetical protein BG000_002343 [Podila horticola]|nr:hypothetical protein BG000_002343 [Podila horticola]
MGNRCFDNYFDDLENYVGSILGADPDHPELAGCNRSWAALREDLRNLLMSEEVIRYRAPEEYMLACRQCEDEVIYGYNKRLNTILERHRRWLESLYELKGKGSADTIDI